MTAGLERARARAAARYLAGQMALARTQAVTQSTTVALRFQRSPGGLTIAVYRDGNGNGVRTRDIDSGVDRLVEPPVRLEDLFPGVLIGVPATSTTTAVELGGSDLLSFTPAGTATSGTISILGRDGSQFAVRVLGVTGRVRLLRFDSVSQQWVESF
jgi:Tfp pilus assembly protein FimT